MWREDSSSADSTCSIWLRGTSLCAAFKSNGTFGFGDVVGKSGVSHTHCIYKLMPSEINRSHFIKSLSNLHYFGTHFVTGVPLTKDKRLTSPNMVKLAGSGGKGQSDASWRGQTGSFHVQEKTAGAPGCSANVTAWPLPRVHPHLLRNSVCASLRLFLQITHNY